MITTVWLRSLLSFRISSRIVVEFHVSIVDIVGEWGKKVVGLIPG
ncbi:MAG TPA: hypothetical protein VMW77_00830 [Methanoregula sp.]|nr:hypothetical protein [Methanoregula sp.]